MSNESRYYYRFAYIKGSLTPRFPYPATTQPETNLYEGNTNEWVIKNSDIQNPTVIRVLGRDYRDDGDYSGIMAFAYAPPTGGRVYWQFHPFGTQPANAQKITDLLIAGTNWAAGRE